MAHHSTTPTVPQSRDGERRLTAIAFTDIVGYSALANRDDANAIRLVEAHFALVREIAVRFGGKIIKTIGDSVLFEFSSAQVATACSIAIQQAHRERNTRVAEAQRFEIRIGLHLGDVEHRGGDVYGDGVNIAARLQPLAPVGGIAISDHMRNQLRLDLRNQFASRGTPALKNIETPIQLFVLESDVLAGIEVDLPPAPPAPTAGPGTSERPPSWPRRRAPILVAAVLVVALLSVALAFAPGWRSKATADISDQSIAVLPFVDMSQAKDQEYFSDGIAEDLLNLLTKVQTLQVAARTSSFSFKGKDVAIQQIAVALRVAHVLQGSVRKSGNQVRITAQLVRAKDGYQIWSQSWDRQIDDVFRIQDEIAQTVVDELKIQLLGRAPTAKPVDPKVYPLILQAEMLLQQYSPESMKRSVALYEQALAIAPDEARAWAGLGRVLANQVLAAELAPSDGLPRAKDAANKALKADPTNVIALTTLGLVAEVELDLPAAVAYYQRASDLEPQNQMLLNQISYVLMSFGRTDEVVRIDEFKVARDPANSAMHVNLGSSRFYARQWEGSIEALRTAQRLNPDSSGVHFSMGQALLVGRKDAAAALAEFAAEPNESSRLTGEAIALHALGRAKDSDARFQALIQKFGQGQPTLVALVHAYRGNPDAAFEWLDKAAGIQDPALLTLSVEPFLDSLHGDARWLPLLRRIGRAPEQVASIELKVALPDRANW